jgi:hypothetical protein
VTTPRRPVAPGPVIHGNPAEIVGRPWTQAIFWVVVLAAAAVDIATFYQVLVVVLNAPDWLVWSAVIGFVAIVLTLAHHAGLYIRRAVDPRHVTAAGAFAWAFGGAWLFLGLVAFAVRFIITQPLSSDASTFTGDAVSTPSFNAVDTTSQHVTAVLFLAFYIATGLITGLVGGYARPDPNAELFGRAVDKRSAEMLRHANTKRRFARVVQLADELADAEVRSKEAWAAAQQECEAIASRLKQEIRLRLATLPLPPSGQQAGPHAGHDSPVAPGPAAPPNGHQQPKWPEFPTADDQNTPASPVHRPSSDLPQPDNEEPKP